MISAVNPVCYPMQYDHHYGDYGCETTCGEWVGPVVPTTLPPTTTTTVTTTPYVCNGTDCTEPPTTTTVSTTTTTVTTTSTTTTPTCEMNPWKVMALTIVDQSTLPVSNAYVTMKSVRSFA